MSIFFVEKNVRSFYSAKASLIFSMKNFSVFGYKVIKHLTSWPLNDLIKLRMLWTTRPGIYILFPPVDFNCVCCCQLCQLSWGNRCVEDTAQMTSSIPPSPVFSCPGWSSKVYPYLLLNILVRPFLLFTFSSFSFYFFLQYCVFKWYRKNICASFFSEHLRHH